jgi:hypothetical protein
MCLWCVLNSVLTLCEWTCVYAISIHLDASSLLIKSQKSVPMSQYRGPCHNIEDHVTI